MNRIDKTINYVKVDNVVYRLNDNILVWKPDKKYVEISNSPSGSSMRTNLYFYDLNDVEDLYNLLKKFLEDIKGEK